MSKVFRDQLALRGRKGLRVSRVTQAGRVEKQEPRGPWVRRAPSVSPASRVILDPKGRKALKDLLGLRDL